MSGASDSRPTGDSVRYRVNGLEFGEAQTTLHTEATGPLRSVVVAGRPDVSAAWRRLRSARRIDRVEVTVTNGGTEASIAGTRHRLPFVSRLPLAVALGLTELGVRTTVRTRSA